MRSRQGAHLAVAVGVGLLVMAAIVSLRSMLPSAYGGKPFRYRVVLLRHGGEIVAKMQIASMGWEKGRVRIAAAQLNGIEAIALPPRLGEVGGWKSFEIRFPAAAARPDSELLLTTRYRMLFGRTQDVELIRCRLPE